MSDVPVTRLTLLLRLRDRADRDAWARFVDVYGPLVYGLARRHGLADADAADQMQEVLLAIARGVERYERDRGPFRTWLYAVAMNKLRTFWKQSRRVPAGSDSAIDNLPDRADPDDRWDREYKQRLFSAASEKVRAEVSPAHWQVFWQFAVEGKPGADVATACGVKVDQVYVIRQRVQKRLSEAILELEEE